MTIRITSRKEGFRRCGVVHSATPTEYPDDRFAEEELERLKEDPMLIIEYLDDGENEDLDKEKKQVKPEKDK